ncbi:MAG: hypothetical protein ACYCVH_01210, partial [Ignavibacteriaceae bacterium]
NVSDFSSRDKFYEDFNKSVNDKAVKVTLSNDSSFFMSTGAAIENDTLYSLGKEIKSGIKKIALTDTKGINYSNQSHTTALIILNDGKRYQAEQLRGNRDSIEFSFTKIITLKDVTSINDIKNISYKNHWLGIIPGFIGGTIFGLLAGVIAIQTTPGTNNTSGGQAYYIPPTETPAKIVASSGVILGIAYGWFKGFNYTYQFNP